MGGYYGSSGSSSSGQTSGGNYDPTTQAVSQAMQAVNRILKNGRQSYGLGGMGRRAGGMGGVRVGGTNWPDSNAEKMAQINQYYKDNPRQDLPAGQAYGYRDKSGSSRSPHGGYKDSGPGSGGFGYAGNGQQQGQYQQGQYQQGQYQQGQYQQGQAPYAANQAGPAYNPGGAPPGYGYSYTSGTDSGAPATGSYGGGGGYARGGLVRGYANGGKVINYDDGGEVDDNEDDPTDTQNDPTDDQIAQQDQAQDQEQDDQENDNGEDYQPQTFGDQNNTPWYSQDNGMLPINMAKTGANAIMNYLHGSDGWNKQQVDAAMLAAETADSSEKVLADHAAMGSEPSVQGNDEDTSGFEPRQDKAAPTPPSTAGGDEEEGQAAYNGPDLSHPEPNDEDFTSYKGPDESDANSYDNTAAKALQQIGDTHGDHAGFGLLQGMRKLWNALTGHAAAAAEGHPDRPADMNAAANSFNMASKYMPGPYDMKATANENGGVTVAVKNAGKTTTHDLSPQEFAAVMNPGTGMQFDKVLQHGPTKVVQDTQAQAQGQQDQFNNPAAQPQQGGGSTQAPAPTAQRQFQPPGQRPGQRVTDNTGMVHNKNPGAVTIFQMGRKPTNGWGENIASNDPRTLGNQKAAAAQRLETAKSDAAYDRAELRAKAAQAATDQRAEAAKNSTQQRADAAAQRSKDNQANLAMQKAHFDALARYRDNHDAVTLANRLMQNDNSLKPEDALMQAGQALDKQSGRQRPQTQIQGAPRPPQPQAPQVPPPTQRTQGQTYQTPKGPMIWMGTGWKPANGG